MFYVVIVLAALATGQQPTWVKRNPQLVRGFTGDIAFGQGKFVVVGNDQFNIEMFYSTDGLNWKQTATFSNDDHFEAPLQLYNVVYDEAIGFVALCNNAGEITEVSPPIFTSADGIAWKAHNNSLIHNGGVDMGDVMAGNGVIVAVPDQDDPPRVLVSRDGVTFTWAYVPQPAIALLGDQFVAYTTERGSDITVYTSVNATSWKILFNASGVVNGTGRWPPHMQGVSRTKSAWLVVLADGDTDEWRKMRTYVLRSADNGKTWSVTELEKAISQAGISCVGDTCILTAVQYTGANVVTMRYLKTTDGGLAWKNMSSNGLLGEPFVSTVGGLFYAVQDLNDNGYHPGVIQVSRDLGVTWQINKAGILDLGPPMYINDVLVAQAFSNAVASHDDGVTWTTLGAFPASNLYFFFHYSSLHKRYYGPVSPPSGSSSLPDDGTSAIAVSYDLQKWDLIPGPGTNDTEYLHAWYIGDVLLTTEGSWMVAVIRVDNRHGTSATRNSSSSSSNSTSSCSSSSSSSDCRYVDTILVYISTAGGWRLLNTSTYTNNAGEDASLSEGGGWVALELANVILVSRDRGESWVPVREGRDFNCAFACSPATWVDLCMKSGFFYANTANVTDWRPTQTPTVPGLGVAVTWLPPSSWLPEGLFVVTGWDGVLYQSTDGVKWVPGWKTVDYTIYTEATMSSKGTVVIYSGMNAVMYTSNNVTVARSD